LENFPNLNSPTHSFREGENDRVERIDLQRAMMKSLCGRRRNGNTGSGWEGASLRSIHSRIDSSRL
jgi:hypothetical protein